MSDAQSNAESVYDIVVFGATSFVGELVCRYLVQLDDAPRWAMAARSEDKLKCVKNQIAENAALSTIREIPIIIADSTDTPSLTELCRQTKVVISTVGPYALYGEPLIKACAETGTDYCDLAGEIYWIRRMIDRYQQKAQETNARIVHCCGFDSIPSDLGVHFLQQVAWERLNQYCGTVKMRVRGMSGKLSGGTMASMINSVKEMLRDPEARRQMRNPYSLCPTAHDLTAPQADIHVSYDGDFHNWIAPFVMATINTPVVHRSNALAGAPYSREFQYDEATLCGDGGKGHFRAWALNVVLQLFGLAIAFAPTRWLLQALVLPKPGQGPSPKQQEEGFFDIRFIGRTNDGLILTARVTGDRDPGYGSTSKMLSQSALCLALKPHEHLPGGFWTPATALGNALIERLQNDAGLTFEVLGEKPT